MNQKASVSKELNAKHRKVSLSLRFFTFVISSSVIFSTFWFKDLIFSIPASPCYCGNGVFGFVGLSF